MRSCCPRCSAKRPAIEDKLPAMSRALGLQQTDFEPFHTAICEPLTSSPFR